MIIKKNNFYLKSDNEQHAEQFVSCSEKHTMDFAEQFSKKLIPGDVVCLDGDLGSGKTTFVKGAARFFKIEESNVLSPTFTYLNLYPISPKKDDCCNFFFIAHFDLYRLQEEEFLSMGLDEYFQFPYISFIEWPERINISYLLDSCYIVSLCFKENTRKIIFDYLVFS